MTPSKRAPLLAFVSALVGGAFVALLLVAFDVVGSTTTKTVVQQAPLSEPVQQGSARGLTARDIYKRDAPGVAFIRANIVQQTQSPFGTGPMAQQGTATGSGFVIDKNGSILTNAHVVADATKITVSFGNKESVPAQVVGRDVSDDLALIKVNPSGLNLKPLALGDAQSVQVGDPTIAIGNPFGLDRTLTTGVVSALQRKIQAPNGFAIPINTAKKALPQLQKGNVERGFLGISGSTVKPSMNLAVKSGVVVESVDPNSGADKAGIQGAQSTNSQTQAPAGGDVITKVDGKDINGIEQLRSAVGGKKPGDKVTLTVLHGGQTKDVQVTLGSPPTVLASDPNGGQGGGQGGGQQAPQIP